jgi:hypothetical protein
VSWRSVVDSAEKAVAARRRMKDHHRDSWEYRDFQRIARLHEGHVREQAAFADGALMAKDLGSRSRARGWKKTGRPER